MRFYPISRFMNFDILFQIMSVSYSDLWFAELFYKKNFHHFDIHRGKAALRFLNKMHIFAVSFVSYHIEDIDDIDGSQKTQAEQENYWW